MESKAAEPVEEAQSLPAMAVTAPERKAKEKAVTIAVEVENSLVMPAAEQEPSHARGAMERYTMFAQSVGVKEAAQPAAATEYYKTRRKLVWKKELGKK